MAWLAASATAALLAAPNPTLSGITMIVIMRS